MRSPKVGSFAVKSPNPPSIKYLAGITVLVNFMITGFSILDVEGKIESAQSLSRQRFPKLNINIEKVESVRGKGQHNLLVPRGIR